MKQEEKEKFRKQLWKDAAEYQYYDDEIRFEWAYIQKLIEREKTRKTLGEWKL